VVQYKSSWFENIDDIDSDSESDSHSEIQKIPALHILMELCEMTLKEAFNTINKQLNQSNFENITPVGACIASHLFIDIVKGVNYLHSQNPVLIHRDIKMSNILLTKDWRIKISDFGLTTQHQRNMKSKLNAVNYVSSIDKEGYSQSHSSRIGTLRYSAPEIKSGKYNEKADIYSLGVLFMEMFNVDIKRFNFCFKYI
jgi:serine/threonine protein kinase